MSSLSSFLQTCFCLFFFALTSITLEATSLVVQEEFVFHNPPFASCHASTLTENHKGEVLCSWFAGEEEGARDVAIWLSSQKEGQWSPPVEVAREDAPCWNPVLYTMPSGEILLFYKVGPNPQQWSGVIKRSTDGGNAWSDPIDLPAGIIGPAKNRPLLLQGEGQEEVLLCGSSTESWRRWGCWVDRTTDGGKTWEKSNPINVDSQLFGIIQPALVFSTSKKIKLFARSHQIGSICTAESLDGGVTWSRASSTSLPNPNSAIDAIRLVDGRILLVYNHSKRCRYPLNIALSRDGGETWEKRLVLEEAPGEYSYPCVIQTKDEKIHISYTWNRKNIKRVVLDPSCL